MAPSKKSRVDTQESQFAGVSQEFNESRPGNVTGDAIQNDVNDDKKTSSSKGTKRKNKDHVETKQERKKRKNEEPTTNDNARHEEDAPADGDDMIAASPYGHASNSHPPSEQLIAEELQAQHAIHEQHMRQLMNFTAGVADQPTEQPQDKNKKRQKTSTSVYDEAMAHHDEAIAAQAAQAAHEAVQFQERPPILPPGRMRHDSQNMEGARYPEEMMHQMQQPIQHQYPHMQQMYYPHPNERQPMHQLLDPALQGHSYYDHHAHSFEPHQVGNVEQTATHAESPSMHHEDMEQSNPGGDFDDQNPGLTLQHLAAQAPPPVKPKRRLQTGSPGPEGTSVQRTASKKSSATSSAPREKKAKGEKKVVPGNSGKFSDEELATLRLELQKYREARNITVFEQNALLAEPMAGETKELYNQLCDALPERARISISKICRRRFHNYEKRGAWNEEEDEELRRLQASQPNKWKQIGDALGRHPEDARDRWRNYLICGDNLVKNQWSLEEENELRRIVEESLRQGAIARRAAAGGEAIQEQESTAENDMNFVDWQAISRAMNHKRSRLQCMAKWKRLTEAEADTVASMNTGGKDLDPFNKSWRVGAAMETYKELSKVAKLELIRAIQDSESTRESKVPWNKLTGPELKPYATMVKKIAWATMRDTIPDNENIPVQDICKTLLPRLEDPNDPFGVPEAPTSEKYINPEDDLMEGEVIKKAKRGRKPREPKTMDAKQRDQKPKGVKVVKSKLRDGMAGSNPQAYGNVQDIAEHALLAGHAEDNGHDAVALLAGHVGDNEAILPPVKQRGRPKKMAPQMSNEYVYDDAMPLQEGYDMHDGQVAAVAPMMMGDGGIADNEAIAQGGQMNGGAGDVSGYDGYNVMEDDAELRIQPGLQDIV